MRPMHGGTDLPSDRVMSPEVTQASSRLFPAFT